MPRKVQRFSRLLDKLRASGGNFSTDDGETAKFHQFITGQRKITVDNAIEGNARKLASVAILPFNKDIAATPTAADRYAVTMSVYSYAGWDSRIKSQVTANELGWAAPDSANESAKAKQFYPALAKFTMTRSGAVPDNNKVSGVTGKIYKYTPRRNFSLPFGRTLSSVVESAKGGAAPADIEKVEYQGVQNSIFEQATEPLLNGLIRIGFEPEVSRQSKVTAGEYGGTIQTTNVTVA